MIALTYPQYKINTQQLIRSIVTTALLCVTPEVYKPRNNNSKLKKRAAQAARAANASAFPAKISMSKIVSLSTAIAEANEDVPDAIYALFESVISARTAAYDIWTSLTTIYPDPEIEKSNQGHRAFLDALQAAYDALGGGLWRQKKC